MAVAIVRVTIVQVVDSGGRYKPLNGRPNGFSWTPPSKFGIKNIIRRSSPTRRFSIQLARMLLLVIIRNHKCHVCTKSSSAFLISPKKITPLTKTLFEIQPRITETLVSQTQLVLAHLHTSSNALRHAEPFLVQLARKLEAHASHARGAFRVNSEAARDFLDNRGEIACFEARRGGVGAKRLSLDQSTQFIKS